MMPMPKDRPKTGVYSDNKVSTFIYDLVAAEEKYLEIMGWTKVSESKNGLHSTWKNPEFTMVYSRNHAVLMVKARDQNLGYW
jgi:hypothetical protein